MSSIDLIPVFDRGRIPDSAIVDYDEDGIAILADDFNIYAFMHDREYHYE